MTVAVWPLDLPPSTLQGWGYITEPNVIGGFLDKGRRRYTRARKGYSVSLRLTFAQLEIWQTFFDEALLDGALPFEWERPHDQQPAIFLIQGVPQVQHMAGSTTNGIYTVTFAIKEVA